MFKNLLKKTVALAAHKSAKIYLGIVCFFESIFFPIPPDVMIVPMTIAKSNEWIKIASTATITSVIGGCAGSTACGIKIFRFQLLFLFLNNSQAFQKK